MATKLPHTTITPIGQDRPAAVPELWNSRYTEIDENFAALAEKSGASWCECTTSAANAKKAVTYDGFVLATGAMLIVRFVNENTAENPTLNVNGTGAYPMVDGDSPVSTSQIVAGGLYIFVFDGTNWALLGSYNKMIEADEIDQLFAADETAAAKA